MFLSGHVWYHEASAYHPTDEVTYSEGRSTVRRLSLVNISNYQGILSSFSCLAQAQAWSMDRLRTREPDEADDKVIAPLLSEYKSVDIHTQYVCMISARISTTSVIQCSLKLRLMCHTVWCIEESDAARPRLWDCQWRSHSIMLDFE
jgi:hypothetical protein